MLITGLVFKPTLSSRNFFQLINERHHSSVISSSRLSDSRFEQLMFIRSNIIVMLIVQRKGLSSDLSLLTKGFSKSIDGLGLTKFEGLVLKLFYRA